ncbi:MAG: glycosyltransferase [Crocinitomix sp.]|nr:glycosyltransferase [Crocinitomix sp.]
MSHVFAAFTKGNTHFESSKHNNASATNELPPVSIIIACYNEESFIRSKLTEILSKANWIEGSELIVVSTGSTDTTDQILREFDSNPNVHLCLIPERISKIDAVNYAVNICRHKLLVFSDCRQKMKVGSIQRLVSKFQDPTIGTVAASLLDTKNDESPSFFRKMYHNMALNQSKVGSCFNVYGALYAQRKSVYRKIPTDLLFDDLFVVVSTISQGMRLVQEKEAVIYDVSFYSYYKPERVQRLTRGLLLFLFNHKKLIFSLPPTVLFRFLMYKYLKLLMPFLLLAVFLLTALLSYMSGFFGAYFGILFVVLAVLFIFNLTRNFLVVFIQINWYFFLATINFVFFNKRSKKWKKLNTANENPATLL